MLIEDSLTFELARAVGIVLAAGLVAWIIRLVGRQVSARFEAKLTPLSIPIPKLLKYTATPVSLLLIFQGFFWALKAISYFDPWQSRLVTINVSVVIILTTYILAQIVRVFLGWYAQTIAARTETTLDDTFIPLIHRTLIWVVYIIGVLVLLDLLGISIAPMLTGLGLSGLAVALALQPTLASFFAGIQVITDRVVNLDDYVELESGIRGYVEEIGWRSTRIRTTYENLVVIPNSRLVESIITNYDYPHREVAVIVEAGVSYSSNLAQVEQVAMDVARELIQELPEAAKNMGEPWFGYDEFGESNINFWVWLYATDYISTFRLKSELVKRLHGRFNQEGISINYPVRKLVYQESGGTLPTPPARPRQV